MRERTMRTRVAPVVEVELLEHAAHDRSLVAVVVDDETSVQAGGLGVAAEELRARRVEGADPEVARPRGAEQPAEALRASRRPPCS